jgi:ribonuclease P protein subunit POP4
VLLPTFPPRPTGTEDVSMGLDLKVNAPVVQAKLVKAEFVGCKLVGASQAVLRPFCESERGTDKSTTLVKRAKNPSLLGISGIVLQETLGTFKVVTPKSEVKGALDFPSPLLDSN